MQNEFYLDDIGEAEQEHQVKATIRLKSKEWVRNARNNEPLIKKHGGERERNFSGREVFIIGTGESLDEYIDFIKEVQDKVIIIASDMAYRPLLVAGIKPQICFTLETRPDNRFFDGVDTEGVHLSAYSLANSQVIRTWKGSIAFFNLKGATDYSLEKIYKRTAFKRLPFYSCGGNVFSAAFVYAYNCNPKNMFFVGNDLGYTKDYYCRETFRGYERQRGIDRFNPMERQERNIIMARRRDGREMVAIRETSGEPDFKYLTDGPFLMVQRWMDEAIKKYNIRNVFCVSKMGIQNAQKGSLKC